MNKMVRRILSLDNRLDFLTVFANEVKNIMDFQKCSVIVVNPEL